MKSGSKNDSMIRTIILHVLVWGGILSAAFFMENFTNKPRFLTDHEHVFKLFRISSILFLALVFYINTYLVLPKIVTKIHWVIFILLNTALLILYTRVAQIFFENVIQSILIPGIGWSKQQERSSFFPPKNMLPPYWTTIFPFLMSNLASLAFFFMTSNMRSERRRREEKMELLSSELQFLKSQVSPHFLFNILNSFTFLARTKSAILEPALVKLSSLLRYMLYETNEQTTLLVNEVNYLKDYIALQKLRYHDLIIHTDFQSLDMEKYIAPMLLIPFVENAFKHAALAESQNGFIQVSVREQAGRLLLFVANSYDPFTPNSYDKDSGIGLANVTKRLTLLYQNDYALRIERQEKVFMVFLEIPLKNIV